MLSLVTVLAVGGAEVIVAACEVTIALIVSD